MARPKLDIDATEVYSLAKLHCTNEEIAAFFGCSTDTIERRFAGQLAKGKAEGKLSLRRMQWRRAEKGSDTMLIFLGKQYLGQADKTETEHSGDINLIIGKELKEV